MNAVIRTVILAALAAPAFLTPAKAAEGNPAPVQLVSQPPLAEDVDAFPRLGGNQDDPAVKRVNRSLAYLNRKAAAFVAECKNNGGEMAETTRSVAVTMTGARYLSLVANDEWFCGGAHPDSDSLAMTYDLTTGRPVDWMKLLPASLGLKAITDSIGDGTKIGMITSKPLLDLYLGLARKSADYDRECDQSFDKDTAFQVWPDAKADGIVLWPSTLPHVVSACANPVTIPTARWRELGADPALLADIDSAHAAIKP